MCGYSEMFFRLRFPGAVGIVCRMRERSAWKAANTEGCTRRHVLHDSRRAGTTGKVKEWRLFEFYVQALLRGRLIFCVSFRGDCPTPFPRAGFRRWRSCVVMGEFLSCVSGSSIVAGFNIWVFETSEASADGVACRAAWTRSRTNRWVRIIAQDLSRRCSFGERLNQWMFCNADRRPGFRSVSGVGRHEEGEAERERFRQADVAYLIKGAGGDVAAYPGIWKSMFYCLTQSTFEWSEFCMETIANPFSLEGDMPCCIDCDDRPIGGAMRADCRSIAAKTRGRLC